MDEIPWIPFDRGISNCFFKPLRFDLNTGTWIYLFKIKSNQTLTRHRHTGGAVIGYNIQGQWKYAGREWRARPGTFIFEPPGDIHTLMTGLLPRKRYSNEGRFNILEQSCGLLRCRDNRLRPLTLKEKV